MPELDSRRVDRRVALRLAVLLLVFYAGFAGGGFKSSDEYTVYETTASIWDRGTLEVGPAPYTAIAPDGRRYSQYALGQSVLALPFFGAGRVASNVLPEPLARALAGPRVPPKGPPRRSGRLEMAAVALFAPLATALLVALFFCLERRLGASPRSALAASGMLALCTYVAMHAKYFLRHTTTTALLLAALLAFLRWRDTGRAAALAAGSALASAIVLVRLPDAILGLPLGLWLAWLLAERARRDGVAAVARQLPALAGPLVVAAGLHLWGNHARWGTWIDTPILTQSNLFTTPLLHGLHGLLLSPGVSVFAYSPLLLLAPWALRALARRDRALAGFALGASLLLLVLYAKFYYWPGLPTCPGPRYLFAAVPLLLLGLGPWLDAARGRRAVIAPVATLALLGFVVALGLLLADWLAITRVYRYRMLQVPWDHLFVLAKSPILGAWHVVGMGEVDAWLWRLGEGWAGQEARPGVAALLAALWLAALGLAGGWLWRAARSAPADRGSASAPRPGG
jgi:hypothetical protein